jgi:hypothetical protein
MIDDFKKSPKDSIEKELQREIIYAFERKNKITKKFLADS